MLAHRITKLRIERGITQSQLAMLLHISPSTIGMYEQGRRTPSIDVLIALSRTFSVSLDYLITGTDYLYADTTSRRISFEYAMMNGVNDTPECAEELAKRLKGILCHINLIPANEVPEKGHKRSNDSDIQRFKSILEKSGHTVTVRRTLGSDINASCGQLRREKIKQDSL